MHVWHMPVFAPQSMVCTECAATSCKRHLCSYVCGSCAVVYVSMCGDRYLSGCEPDIIHFGCLRLSANRLAVSLHML